MAKKEWEVEPSANASIPPVVLDLMREVANKHNVTAEVVFREAIRLGLVLIEAQDLGGKILLRTDESEESIIIDWDNLRENGE